MDTLYIGDIPLDYKYAQFSNGYITLYNKPQGNNETLHYYRIYTSTDDFYYSEGDTNFGNYNTTYFTEINVSNNWAYRRDFADICLTSFIIFLFFFVFLFNIITSFIRKGGVLGGLF